MNTEWYWISYGNIVFIKVYLREIILRLIEHEIASWTIYALCNTWIMVPALWHKRHKDDAALIILRRHYTQAHLYLAEFVRYLSALMISFTNDLFPVNTCVVSDCNTLTLELIVHELLFWVLSLSLHILSYIIRVILARFNHNCTEIEHYW